mmetsp:Transcript_16137/g.18399  ORF Transcript_16137/g.18399 Transcript_16137/m.18399 type:complete len:388 (+) Transcript_16137:285-1448(+)
MKAANEECHDEPLSSLPPFLQSSILITYRSVGLGLYGAIMRYAGMPLEKIALYMNSSQVSGKNQLRQAIHLTFQDGQTRSFLTPYKVVGPASGVAWFLQYSVMGMVFQLCDRSLSAVLGIPVMPYGAQLMEDPANDQFDQEENSTANKTKHGLKIILAPTFAGLVESMVSNRAEVQRFYGINKLAQVESTLKWNPISRICGPAFLANSSRNCIMSATSFVITPVLYRKYYTQEDKSKTSLFWFGLGVNIFLGNAIAITQQSLWGRSLDYACPKGDGSLARNIHYRTVIKDALNKEGIGAFLTVPKWASRVLMNAPVQGTLPWFYNEVLPLAEGALLSKSNEIYIGLQRPHKNVSPSTLARKLTKNSQDLSFANNESKTTATSPRLDR